MALLRRSKDPKVNLTKYVQVAPNEWRFCPVVVAKSGRIKPHHIIFSGHVQVHSEGSYYLDWYENGKRRRESVGDDALTAVQARERKAALLLAKARGIKIDEEQRTPKQQTLADACDEFLSDIKEQRRPKTYGQYSVALRYFQESCGESKRLHEIERRDLLNFDRFMRDEKRLTGRTRWTKFNVAVQLLKANGITGLVKKRDWPKFVMGGVEIYTEDELHTFLGACDEGERTLFSFFLMTGFRDQEVQYVEDRDIDLAHNVVRVAEKPQWGFIPKDWERREVPIPDSLVELLRRHLAKRPAGSQLVFGTSGDEPNYHMLAVCKRIALNARLNCGRCDNGGSQCSKSATCEHWYLHKFRATFATKHLRSGVDVTTVQSWMGHKDLASTMRYLQPARAKDSLTQVNATFQAFAARPRLVKGATK